MKVLNVNCLRLLDDVLRRLRHGVESIHPHTLGKVLFLRLTVMMNKLEIGSLKIILIGRLFLLSTHD